MDLFTKKSKNLELATAILIISGGFVVILTVILMALLLISSRKGTEGKMILADDSPRQIAVVKINQQEIQVEIAATLDQQYQGLSGRQSICADCGMLFNFSDSEVKSFVMRQMEFPLDIIFIDNGVIRNIAAGLEPEGNNPTRIYTSSGPVNQVLEINSGYCQKYNIQPGDKVSPEY